MASIQFELIVVILGIFVSLAFASIAAILKKLNLGIGIWPLLSVAILFFTGAEYFRSFFDNITLFRFCIIVGMILFFFAALIKYWDIMELTE